MVIGFTTLQIIRIMDEFYLKTLKSYRFYYVTDYYSILSIARNRKSGTKNRFFRKCFSKVKVVNFNRKDKEEK